MCGIFGMTGEVPLDKQVESYFLLEELAVQTQTRGRHATGFAAVVNNRFVCAKAPMNAQKFVQKSDTMKSLMVQPAQLFVGHCRYATHGHPENNKNNHPFMNHRYAMVHNGVIHSYEQVCRQLGLKLSSECDSETILRIIEREKDPIVGIRKVFRSLSSFDSFACALLDRKTKKVYLFRNNLNPCYVAKIPALKSVIFASTQEIVEAALKDVFNNDPDFTISKGWSLTPNKIYVLSSDSLEIESVEALAPTPEKKTQEDTEENFTPLYPFAELRKRESHVADDGQDLPDWFKRLQ